MPRPMMPAPITATVRISVTIICPLCPPARDAEARSHSRVAGADAAQGGGDVVDVIHEADQFSSCGHEGSLRFPDASADLTAAARATIHCSTCGPIWQRR